MSELKCCPFCGEEPAIEEYPDPNGGMKWNEPYYVACKSCGTYKNDFATKEEAIADWNRRHTSNPCQLTLDELRQMDGQPVYIVAKHFRGWDIVRVDKEDGHAYFRNIYDGALQANGYGKTWAAYDRQPGGEGK